jgi:CheY-like chemotaxis protein
MCKILIVDDNPEVRETLSGFLSDFGYAVKTVINESETLNSIVNEHFNFVLIDVRLHGIENEDESGLSLTMAIRKLDPQAKIIVLSRYSQNKDLLRSLRYHGVVAFIDKINPNWAEQILSIIQTTEGNDKFLKFEIDTKLSLSLTVNQPLSVRVSGRHVYSIRTAKILQMEVERYTRQAKIASVDKANSRFHISQIGQELWNNIFDNHREVDNTLRESNSKSQLLSISIEAPREFLRLPLEFIRNTQEYLVLQHPFARFVYDAVPRNEAISPRLLASIKKLRVLIIASNTLPPISGVDIETRNLYNYLSQQNFIPIDVKLIPTEEATYERVKNELKKHVYDIIHYAGHGLYRIESPEESSLFFWSKENKEGEIVALKASELKLLLDLSKARLFYLSSCYGTVAG